MLARVVITVERGNPWATVESPFEAKDAVKAVPGRKWNASRKVWLIPSAKVKVATRIIRAEGYDVIVDGDGVPQSNVELFDQVLAVCGDQKKAVYRRLAQALHPDAGGNEALCKALNEAWERHAA